MSDGSRTVSRTLRPFWELRTLRQEGSRTIVLYLQGQLFFGSGQSLAAALVAAVEGHSSCSELGSVRYCILSFSKVPSIDASAAEQLKIAIKRISRHGCKVVFCRMGLEVFQMLSACNIIKSPDIDLRRVLNIDRQEELVQRPASPEDNFQEDDLPLQEDDHMMASRSLHWKKLPTFRDPSKGDQDAFDDETDALNYCERHLLREFCYIEGGMAISVPTLEPYMRSYGNACAQGARLDEEVFEKLNRLSPGTMASLRPFCDVRTGLAPRQELDPNTVALHFVLQGGVALVDVHRQGEADSLVSMKGFHGRGRQRLRKRYPPGSVISHLGFLLPAERLVDSALVPSIIVSGKFAGSSEVWSLQRESWAQLPTSLMRALEDMLLLQAMTERQHTL
eukprot:CAMPEP_0172904090 /NCGR_PEP_ID=MMETSP1075-20121228/171883_1 /TAXON_ID=2916 /ORGANISM="Ceratium fusus, Strain PA161109" /LENGTH=392 /DNA_ID=CAMNT_0013761055 /DNA_START=154 /DNA_END=1328 /DNA_ORIENTATION=-